MNNKRYQPHRQNITKDQPVYLCEAEAIPGLEYLLRDEISERFGGKCDIIDGASKDGIRFEYRGNPWQLKRLAMAQAVYLIQEYPIARPKALLGHQYWTLFTESINKVISIYPSDTFRTFTIAAAGSDSSVMRRIKDEISRKLNLIHVEKGDLWIRIRPSLTEGWETLTRLTPRPLTTRDWRIANYKGALNAAVAHAMVKLTLPEIRDRYLNLGCGSGTLLIERAGLTQAKSIIGVDNKAEVLDLAVSNIVVSGHEHKIRFIQSDITCLPFEDNRFDSITADLPFGQRVGTHKDNLILYPKVLQETARVASKSARFVLITHEVKLMDNLIPQFNDVWHLVESRMITLRGLHPRIYVFERR